MVQEAPATERFGERALPSVSPGAGRRIWIVFADTLANRVFFDCGIVDLLHDAYPDRLEAVFAMHSKHMRLWAPRLVGIPVLEREDVMPAEVPPAERIVRRIDVELDKRVGFYPLAIRHSLRHGFHRDRMAPGHPSAFLDSSCVGPLPRWRIVESTLARWHLSARRYVPTVLTEHLRRECDAIVLTNPQTPATRPFLTAARRLRLPVIGYIASWDHQVGKGIISPYLQRYVVQNETMREDLLRYHGIEPSRVTVTGWPQTDVFHRPRSQTQYEELLRRLGLPVDRPVCLFAGNTPHNAPYERNLIARLVQWWRESRGDSQVSLLFRPHPYDDRVDERYGAALDEPGVSLQPQLYTDFDDLVTLLHHVDCVVATGGTIVLDALVNDRPTVLVTFGEGAPPGFDAADRANMTGEHYRQLIASEAFYRAADFDALVDALERALQDPQELREERLRVGREVVGDVDGHAAERVVAAIRETLAAYDSRTGSQPRPTR